MTSPLLAVDRLSVSYTSGGRAVRALSDISFTIAPGQAVGLVGESGSGKSTTALAVLGLLDSGAKIESGSVMFKNMDLYGLDNEGRRKIRGDKISIVFQDPFTSLNPSITVGMQIAEPLVMHRGLGAADALAECERLLTEVGIAEPKKMMRSYPHQLSGGMKQRALIATALACDPELLILDEPTTALDVTVEAQILDLLEGLRKTRSLAILFISHNLGVVSRLCDDICVMYAAQIVESGPTQRVLADPRHPYTKGLLASLPRMGSRRPRLSPIPGRLPDPGALKTGCIFASRCAFEMPVCAQQNQDMVPQGEGRESRCWRAEELAGVPWRHGEPLPASSRASEKSGDTDVAVVEGHDVERVFRIGGWFDSLSVDFKSGGFPIKQRPVTVRAIDKVSIRVGAGEIVGLVGESGCGKTTLGRCLVDLIQPSAGTIRIDGEELLGATHERRRTLLKSAQIVFQNPDSSLNPRKTVREILARPLVLFGLARGAEIHARVDELLDLVNLGSRFADRYPHQMSGGEKQRVGIARALATNPRFIVCDEAVSALDVSVQASILNLLSDLRDELGISYLFISHDLSVVSHIADRICVMYRGAIVESGATDPLITAPAHPYTRTLLAAVPAIPDRG